MERKLTTWCLIVLLGAMTVFLGCSGEKRASEEEAAKYAAKVNDWTFTRADLDAAIEALPDQQKAKFRTPEGKAELAEALIEEEMYHQEALKKGYAKEAKIRDSVAKYERAVLVNEYFQREVKPNAYPPEEEIHDFYEANPEKYTRQPIVRAQHILMADSVKLAELKARVEKGEVFTALAVEYSEDELTRPDGGNLGYFNPGGFVRNVGYSEELSKAAFDMRKGDMKIVKWDRGYSLLVVNEYRPAELRPYEEARDEIKEILAQREIKNVKANAFAELKKKYDATNFLADELMLVERTPEELWNLAQNSTDPHQRLRYYEQIVDKHPDSNYGAEALFMIGFVYAEEIRSYPDAGRAFNRLINEYPNAEVAKTAEWMLENMEKPLPEFDSLEDLQKKIEGGSE